MVYVTKSPIYSINTLMQFFRTAYLSLILSCGFTPLCAQQDSLVKEKNGVRYTDLDIDVNDDYSSFDILLPEINQYNIFFTGENHLFRNSNYKLQLKMLKYLHQKRGVRHLLLEFGFSRGYYVDRYVNTGDTTIIDMLTDYSYPEYVKLYKGIYEYNQTLDSVDRIHVHGIDLERSNLTSIKLLNLLISEKESMPHDSIALDVEAIKSLMGYHDSHYERGRTNYGLRGFTNMGEYSSELTMAEIQRGYSRHKAHYKTYLGEDFLMFDKVMIGLKAETERQRLEANRTLHAKIYRETYMYNRFVDLVDSLDGERFFSQFGRCHTATQEQDEWCNFYHFKTLASRLTSSKHPRLKDKVCSIAAYYPKREVSYLEGEAYYQVNKLVKDLAINDNDMTLIEINDDSTYFGDLVNKFQFLIINNHSLISDLSNSGPDGDPDYSFYGEYPFYVDLTADYSLHWIRMTALNDQLTAQGFQAFSGNQVGYGGSLTLFENFYSAVKFSFSYLPGETREPNDSMSLKLNGWYANFRQGFDITDNKHFNVTPYWGLGASLLRLKYTQPQSNVVISDGLFSAVQDQSTVYRNPGALFDIGADIRLNFSIVTLGVSGGYFFDMSNKQWRRNGQISDPSPRTSFSSPYVNFFVGFSFHD